MPGLLLVVEDEPKIRELLRRSFERAGYAVLTAASGAAALEMAREANPALVVLTLGCPTSPGSWSPGSCESGGTCRSSS